MVYPRPESEERGLELQTNESEKVRLPPESLTH